METAKNLSKLSDQTLLTAAKTLVADERKITTLILHHLREIECRRLFSSLGFSSLYEYCRQELGYSEASAQRRISAMRLIKEVPEVEEKINSGALSLSVISQVQSYFRDKAKISEPLNVHEKIQILQNFENKSTREVEKEILAMSPSEIIYNKEKIRAVTAEQSEIKFYASSGLLKKLEKLKALMAHKSTNISMAELVEAMADISLAKLDPEKKNSRKTTSAQEVTLRQSDNSKSHTRYIPAELRRGVWSRDAGCCQYISAQTGKKCASSYGLEIHHKHAFAKGGEHSLENLMLHCFAHNQLEAVEEFGTQVDYRKVNSQKNSQQNINKSPAKSTSKSGHIISQM